jgi:transcriptional regulator with XRE-family HTH domain
MSGSSELGMFLRARREALRPADVGLVDHGRRRTPGLRREEVAALAGVSIDYVTRLEQGRDVRPSSSVLVALANALRLDDEERAHLVTLATIARSAELCPETAPVFADVSPGVRHLLDDLGSTPAFLVAPISDVIAWNDAWERLVAPLGMLDDAPVNLARYVFLHPRSREVYAEWAQAADEQVARLRAAEPRWGPTPEFAALIDDLRGLDEFASRWSKHPVAEKRRGTKRLARADVGDLEVAYEVLLLPDDDQQLVTWRGADAVSRERIASLLTDARPVSPAQLSVVVNR